MGTPGEIDDLRFVLFPRCCVFPLARQLAARLGTDGPAHSHDAPCTRRSSDQSYPISVEAPVCLVAQASRPNRFPRRHRSNGTLTKAAIGVAVATRVTHVCVRTTGPAATAKLVADAHGSPLDGLDFQRKGPATLSHRLVRELGCLHHCAWRHSLRASLDGLPGIYSHSWLFRPIVLAS